MEQKSVALDVLQQLPVVAGEARRLRMPMAALFAVFALIALGLGAVWPKTYVSHTTVLVQEDNIIQPLMEGRAVATGVVDHSRIAREVIHSRRILAAVLEEGGWLAAKPGPAEQERLAEDLKSSIQVRGGGENLIEISYRDSDPDRTFRVTRMLADMFIAESLAAKERESREAYEFIAARVEEYHLKLTTAEDRLKEFRSDNQDARPGTATDVNTRIGELRQRIEQAQTELSELQMRERELNNQLTGEAALSASQNRESQYRQRAAELQSELDALLLSYTDDYPDVVRVRHQLEDLQSEIAAEGVRRESARGSSAGSDAMTLNPLYQQLRSELSGVRTSASALGARVDENTALLEAELERGRRVADSEAALAELTRDYEVNRDLYQDLLRRRENARVSMSLDSEGRGLSLRIQEPAVLPQIPSGLRFMHFVLAGLGLGLAVPAGLLFASSKFDPRVRSATDLSHGLGVPLLVSVPRHLDARQLRRERWRSAFTVLIVVGTLSAYAVVGWLRFSRTL